MSDVTSLIQSLEEQRCQALINGDAQKLAELFSERLNWCHSSGQVDNKRSLAGAYLQWADHIQKHEPP